LRKYRGDPAEETRLGGSLTVKGGKTKKKETKVPPGLLLAHKWTPEVDPTRMWLSEKLDGVRAYWNGKELISRLGNPFFAPIGITKRLPKDVHLDGELWMGRGLFQKTVSVVRRQDYPKEWAKVVYVIFDVVPHGAVKEDTPFEERLKIARGAVKECNSSFVKLLPQVKCTGVNHLKGVLERIEEMHGEGVMLRTAKSIYERGRSHTLLKVKSFSDDEATVTGYTKGKGRHKGRLGALVMQMANGVEFKLSGMSDKLRNDPPKIGELVTFSYIGLTDAGKPKFAAYVGPAIDK